MTDKIKEFAPKILEAIKSSQKILLHLHPSPDPDSVGSTLAMAHALTDLGKEVMVIAGDSPAPQQLSMLPGFDKIVAKNYSQIDPAAFDLFIILDSAGLEQITKQVKVDFPPGLKTVVIDHHKTNLGFAQIDLIDTSYSATSQLLFDLFGLWQIKITSHIAICLFMGIYGDTGSFKYSPTDSETLKIASELAKINPHFPDFIFKYENSLTEHQIRLLGLALTSIETFYDNHVAVSLVTLSALTSLGIPPKTEKPETANYLKSVINWDIGVSLIETEPNKVGVSFRTRDPVKYDMAKLATALGGGGHSTAAGTVIRGTVDEAKKIILEKIKNLFPDLASPGQ